MPHTTIMIDGDGDDEKKESGEDMPGVEAGNYDKADELGLGPVGDDETLTSSQL